MPKYTVYFSREMFGYKEFEAENDEKAEDIIDNMEDSGHFPRDFDHVRDEGWIFVDYDKHKGGEEK